MEVSITFLRSKYDFFKTIDLINESNCDYIHIDFMDNLLVNNKTDFNEEMLKKLKSSKKKKNVHLMCLHLEKYIEMFSRIKPDVIIYEFEATTNHKKIIELIKDKKCKVGIAINPLTEIKEIIPYLNKIDLVLIMGVIPGYGGQKFIMDNIIKIEELNNIRKDKKLPFLIGVDGGVNEETIKYLENIDIAVVGSYICNSDNYNKKIEKIKNS